jgi:hypothetical protein
MWRLRNYAWRRLARQFVCAGVVCCSLLWAAPGKVNDQGQNKDNKDKDKNTNKDKDRNTLRPLIVRWSEQQPGCTFSRGDDGKYRYGLWSDDVGIVLAVDARELKLAHNPNRSDPIFGVLLEIHYRGAGSLEASPDGITLEFMKHFKVVQSSLDPDNYAQQIQDDADAVDDEIRREVKKHPERKQDREASLQDYQKRANELIEFLGKKTLRPAHLDRGNPIVSGWVFFSTKSKWLGGWKAQEEFVLRVPLAGKIFEFPFKLPPEKGELLLQKRQ